MRALGIRTVAAVVLPLVYLVAPAHASAEVIDISALVNRPFDQTFFADQGLIFTSVMSLGFVQGDDALLGPVTGRFTRPVAGLSALVAPGFQGTADYTLAAFDARANLIRSATLRITQDEGDPDNTGFGYLAVNLGQLSRPAHSFSLTNAFVRSSFPDRTFIDFGVSSFEFTPVPEPGSLFLMFSGGAALLCRRRIR
jgi:PEP-CTERM motif